MAVEHSRIARPPIVAVLGHVDHGKSTLLDFIRKANVVASEAGGITQHVAAYEVEHEHEGEKKRITFIDTPGHAAFQAIRARGARMADVAILVVAADDGVKAQTLEALAAIRAEGTPFVVAINKIDKPNADLNRTHASLIEHQVYLEGFGGEVPWVAISAKTGQGVSELLDLVLLVAEMQELKGDSEKRATGFVVEAHREAKRGIAATLIITDGTLESGQFVRAGGGVAPVRIMEDHRGVALKEASFSTPITLVGFDTLPDVGAPFSTHKSKREAENARTAEAALRPAAAAATAETSDRFLLPVIIRADVSGSLEAIAFEIGKLGDEHAGISIVHSGIGDISEGDVKAAIASQPPAVLIGFHVGVEQAAAAFARERGVDILHFDIIYKLTESLEELMRKRAPKRKVEEVRGRAKILKVFSSRKTEHTIGASILDGTIAHDSPIRIMRRGEKVGDGSIHGMQRNKQSVERVAEGEFGALVELECEPVQGDTLESVLTSMV